MYLPSGIIVLDRDIQLSKSHSNAIKVLKKQSQSKFNRLLRYHQRKKDDKGRNPTSLARDC